MNTLKVILLEYLLGYGLQSFAVVFGIYTFNRQKIVLKNYILASILVTIISCFVKLLPISVGVHTIMIMLFLYLICVIILKMPAYTTIRSTSLVIVLIIICEMVVTGLMMIILGKERFDYLMNDDSLQKSIIGLPSNFIFALVVIIIYIILMKKGDKNRNISS